MFSEYVQDSGHHFPMMFDHVGIYEDIVHVDCHIALIEEVLENVIHHCLEGGWAVGEAKEHDKGFEEALIHSEGGLPLVSLLDLYIVVSPMYMKYFALELEAKIQLMISGMRGSR